jgi:hypothetical protein
MNLQLLSHNSYGARRKREAFPSKVISEAISFSDKILIYAYMCVCVCVWLSHWIMNTVYNIYRFVIILIVILFLRSSYYLIQIL